MKWKDVITDPDEIKVFMALDGTEIYLADCRCRRAPDGAYGRSRFADSQRVQHGTDAFVRNTQRIRHTTRRITRARRLISRAGFSLRA